MNRTSILFFMGFATSVLFSVSIPSHAMEETEAQNRTEPAVKVLKKYPGAWKGWDDGCVNCDKPLASRSPSAKKKKEKVKKRIKKAKSTALSSKSQTKPKSKVQTSGYCECSCNNAQYPVQKVFGVKPKELSEEMRVKDSLPARDNSNEKAKTTQKEIKIETTPVDKKKPKEDMELKDKKESIKKEPKDSKGSDGSKRSGDTGEDKARRIFSLWS